MMNFYKTLFILSTLTGTIISISATSWVGMWLGLEINLLSIIPLMNDNKNLFSTEASLKYFITQAMASAILLLAVIIMMSKINIQYEMNLEYPLILMLNSSLLTKMGAAPFHFWFPEVIEGLSWFNSFMLLTWQKIAPMALLMYNVNLKNFLSFIIIFCMLISSIVGLNQTSLRKILAYSSINHIGWMISSLLFFQNIWMYYFLIYTLITINIVLIFKLMNVFYLKQLFSTLNFNKMVKLFFILNFLSLGGLPPFLGFLTKWMTIQALINSNLIMLALVMIILTLITLFFYIRITFSSLLLSETEISSYLENSKFNNMIIITLNFISLSSLIYCTMIFNWI
uniref:NADH-ubiquinone oxidoreductase chain 2 n=1 Tax=Coomaniella dentata TaxID=2936731 RepID=A0A8T9VVH7_9COLE|nr:NADH dehydrogenase subunit 2 [Coomaniella dentata]UPI13497.1 NADH dehydrogenase subunit 2 [Coomaniella dentata]